METYEIVGISVISVLAFFTMIWIYWQWRKRNSEKQFAYSKSFANGAFTMDQSSVNPMHPSFTNTSSEQNPAELRWANPVATYESPPAEAPLIEDEPPQLPNQIVPTLNRSEDAVSFEPEQ